MPFLGGSGPLGNHEFIPTHSSSPGSKSQRLARAKPSASSASHKIWGHGFPAKEIAAPVETQEGIGEDPTNDVFFSVVDFPPTKIWDALEDVNKHISTYRCWVSNHVKFQAAQADRCKAKRCVGATFYGQQAKNPKIGVSVLQVV